MDLDIKLVNPPHFMVLYKLNCKNYKKKMLEEVVTFIVWEMKLNLHIDDYFEDFFFFKWPSQEVGCVREREGGTTTVFYYVRLLSHLCQFTTRADR